MPTPTIHCPLCDATKVTGLGLVIYDSTALVQYRCRYCGEWFFLSDQRIRQVPEPPSRGD